MGVQNVIITLGSRGAYICNDRFDEAVPAQKVRAVDTTAAGDVFNGALVVALSEGKSLEEAVRFASPRIGDFGDSHGGAVVDSVSQRSRSFRSVGCRTFKNEIMYIVNNYTLAVIFCVVTMICWGSWGNTQKPGRQSLALRIFLLGLCDRVAAVFDPVGLYAR